MLPPTMPKQPISPSLEVDDVHRRRRDRRSTPVDAAEQLGRQRIGLDPLGQGVAVAAVGPGHVVVRLERQAHADGHRLLAGVQVRGAVDLAGQEEALHRVLEGADQQHPLVGDDEVGHGRPAGSTGARPSGTVVSSATRASPESRACNSMRAAKSTSA